MKLWTFSDLHLEVKRLESPLARPPHADVCVVAGDLTRSPVKGLAWIEENVDIPTVYVGGNHEFYDGYVVEDVEAARAASAASERVRFLENGVAVIGGVRFVGATLWTDFELMGNPELAMLYARQRMNDYVWISHRANPWEPFTPRRSAELHEASRAFIREVLAEPFEGPTVVVTHHCPHPKSVSAAYEGDILNAAFASDLEDLILAGRPRLWIHGHTHSSFRYVVGETEVVCNPRGYGRENHDFDPALVIDLDAPLEA